MHMTSFQGGARRLFALIYVRAAMCVRAEAAANTMEGSLPGAAMHWRRRDATRRKAEPLGLAEPRSPIDERVSMEP